MTKLIVVCTVAASRLLSMDSPAKIRQGKNVLIKGRGWARESVWCFGGIVASRAGKSLAVVKGVRA